MTLGALVEIPVELENYDADENAKAYAKWFFENHYEWLKGLSWRWAKKNPQTTWEDCLFVAWERLPLILSKYRRESLFDIKLFVRSQLGYYWFTACYRDSGNEQIRLDRIAQLKEYAYDLVHGVEHSDFNYLENRDEIELCGVESAILSMEDKRISTVLRAILLLNVTYREISALLGVSLGTVANMVDRGLTAIYKANPEHYQNIYLTMRKRVNSTKASTITHNKTNDDAIAEQLRSELQQRISSYWQTANGNVGQQRAD